MSGIAEVLHNLGYRISGSDLADSATLRRQCSRPGHQTCLGHAPRAHRWCRRRGDVHSRHIGQPRSAGCTRKKIPWFRADAGRADAPQTGIAIAGTHGKTTTTSLVDQRAGRGGLDPTL